MRFATRWVVCALAAGLLPPASVGAGVETRNERAEWRAGAARVETTPTGLMWLAGYAARKRPAEGTAQPLHAKALAIEDQNGRRIVIVTVDLIGIRPALRQAVADRARRELGLPADRLLLNASHTHSGPEYRPRPGREAEAIAYTSFLEERLVRVIRDALSALAPARLTFGEARCGFAMNRRADYTLARGDPNAGKAPNPKGPVDHAVPTLRVSGEDGALRAMLFGYACHNTCLSFHRYCGDYAGYAQQYLEEHRPGMAALFLAGCGGDQNPYPRGNGVVPGLTDLDLAQTHGRSLALAVEMALVTHPRPVRGPLNVAWREIPLPYADTSRPSHAYPVQVVQFGSSLTLVALGSEVVVDYSLRLKGELGAAGRAVWVAGYSNDYSGYIPSTRVQNEGGYEAAEGWADGIESRIVGAVHDLDAQSWRPAVTMTTR